jgi:Skp family chaperone for outer membrane proteins
MTRHSTKQALWALTTMALIGANDARAADAAPAVPAAAPVSSAAGPLSGPLVVGVCLLSQQELVSRSKVGAAALARVKSLTQEVQNSLEAEKAALERKGAALNAQRATLPPQQYQAQGMALNQRGQALQSKAADRSRQLEATRARALDSVLHEATPYITQAYSAHACGLLVSREAVLGGNMGNDLTAEVLANLDAKGTPITVELEPGK